LYDVESLSVLAADGTVDKNLLPKLSRKTLVQAFEWMLLSRRLDEQALRYQRQGRTGTFAPALGQEAAQIGSAMCLKEEDWFIPSFREAGAALVRGLSIKNYFLYLMGFEDSNFDLKGTHNTAIAIPVGSQCAYATGIAWSIKLDQKKAAAIVYFGDGATSEGDFHEGLNFCGVLKLPCVFFCQNNQWAISTSRKQQTASQTLAQKALAYGVLGVQVDGNDFFAVTQATQGALERARRGEGATFIEAETYRQSVHTTADDPTVYRRKEEEEEWKKKDPLLRFRLYLQKEGLWGTKQEEILEEKIKEKIKKGYEEAEHFRNSNPDPLAFFDHVYEKMPPYLQWQKDLAAKNIEGRNVIKGASEKKGGSGGGAAAVGELEEAQD
ncbi:MAG: pyruvate dehydrogenase (acetyl-transferring) E1 component subunit alpha, partial [Deltaproteobacteria bacterium]|nr:pyruvate dehydrogenase (acetyl-transferring) E1 component subunit alpha [Deltaproteobacteria bacterium]